MDGELAKLEATIAAIHEDLRAIKERLAALPTTFQFVYVQVCLTVAIFAVALGLLKLTGVH